MSVADWTPDVEEVADVLRTRTVDRNGVETGTWGPDTRPTEDQARRLIDSAVADVVSAISADIPQQANEQAKGVVVLLSAMLIELTYFPEQVATGRSPYDQLKALYDERLARLQKYLASLDTDVPGDDSSAGSPVYAFPIPANAPMIGRSTGW